MTLLSLAKTPCLGSTPILVTTRADPSRRRGYILGDRSAALLGARRFVFRGARL
jgi:hypothetical protein